MKYFCRKCRKHLDQQEFSASADQWGRPSEARTCDACLSKRELCFDGLTDTEKNVLHALESIGVDDVLRNGWPDFAVVIKGSPVFIEVKNGPEDLPKPNQELIHKLLKSLGLHVVVVDGSPNSAAVGNKLRNILSPYFK